MAARNRNETKKVDHAQASNGAEHFRVSADEAQRRLQTAHAMQAQVGLECFAPTPNAVKQVLDRIFQELGDRDHSHARSSQAKTEGLHTDREDREAIKFHQTLIEHKLNGSPISDLLAIKRELGDKAFERFVDAYDRRFGKPLVAHLAQLSGESSAQQAKAITEARTLLSKEQERRLVTFARGELAQTIAVLQLKTDLPASERATLMRQVGESEARLAKDLGLTDSTERPLGNVRATIFNTLSERFPALRGLSWEQIEPRLREAVGQRDQSKALAALSSLSGHNQTEQLSEDFKLAIKICVHMQSIEALDQQLNPHAKILESVQHLKAHQEAVYGSEALTGLQQLIPGAKLYLKNLVDRIVDPNLSPQERSALVRERDTIELSAIKRSILSHLLELAPKDEAQIKERSEATSIATKAIGLLTEFANFEVSSEARRSDEYRTLALSMRDALATLVAESSNEGCGLTSERIKSALVSNGVSDLDRALNGLVASRFLDSETLEGLSRGAGSAINEKLGVEDTSQAIAKVFDLINQRDTDRSRLTAIDTLLSALSDSEHAQFLHLFESIAKSSLGTMMIRSIGTPAVGELRRVSATDKAADSNSYVAALLEAVGARATTSRDIERLFGSRTVPAARNDRVAIMKEILAEDVGATKLELTPSQKSIEDINKLAALRLTAEAAAQAGHNKLLAEVSERLKKLESEQRGEIARQLQLVDIGRVARLKIEETIRQQLEHLQRQRIDELLSGPSSVTTTTRDVISHLRDMDPKMDAAINALRRANLSEEETLLVRALYAREVRSSDTKSNERPLSGDLPSDLRPPFLVASSPVETKRVDAVVKGGREQLARTDAEVLRESSKDDKLSKERREKIQLDTLANAKASGDYDKVQKGLDHAHLEPRAKSYNEAAQRNDQQKLAVEEVKIKAENRSLTTDDVATFARGKSADDLAKIHAENPDLHAKIANGSNKGIDENVANILSPVQAVRESAIEENLLRDISNPRTFITWLNTASSREQQVALLNRLEVRLRERMGISKTAEPGSVILDYVRSQKSDLRELDGHLIKAIITPILNSSVTQDNRLITELLTLRAQAEARMQSVNALARERLSYVREAQEIQNKYLATAIWAQGDERLKELQTGWWPFGEAARKIEELRAKRVEELHNLDPMLAGYGDKELEKGEKGRRFNTTSGHKLDELIAFNNQRINEHGRHLAQMQLGLRDTQSTRELIRSAFALMADDLAQRRPSSLTPQLAAQAESLMRHRTERITFSAVDIVAHRKWSQVQERTEAELNKIDSRHSWMIFAARLAVGIALSVVVFVTGPVGWAIAAGIMLAIAVAEAAYNRFKLGKSWGDVWREFGISVLTDVILIIPAGSIARALFFAPRVMRAFPAAKALRGSWFSLKKQLGAEGWIKSVRGVHKVKQLAKIKEGVKYYVPTGFKEIDNLLKAVGHQMEAKVIKSATKHAKGRGITDSKLLATIQELGAKRWLARNSTAPEALTAAEKALKTTTKKLWRQQFKKEFLSIDQLAEKNRRAAIKRAMKAGVNNSDQLVKIGDAAAKNAHHHTRLLKKLGVKTLREARAILNPSTTLSKVSSGIEGAGESAYRRAVKRSYKTGTIGKRELNRRGRDATLLAKEEARDAAANKALKAFAKAELRNGAVLESGVSAARRAAPKLELIKQAGAKARQEAHQKVMNELAQKSGKEFADLAAKGKMRGKQNLEWIREAAVSNLRESPEALVKFKPVRRGFHKWRDGVSLASGVVSSSVHWVKDSLTKKKMPASPHQDHGAPKRNPKYSPTAQLLQPNSSTMPTTNPLRAQFAAIMLAAGAVPARLGASIVGSVNTPISVDPAKSDAPLTQPANSISPTAITITTTSPFPTSDDRPPPYDPSSPPILIKGRDDSPPPPPTARSFSMPVSPPTVGAHQGGIHPIIFTAVDASRAGTNLGNGAQAVRTPGEIANTVASAIPHGIKAASSLPLAADDMQANVNEIALGLATPQASPTPLSIAVADASGLSIAALGEPAAQMQQAAPAAKAAKLSLRSVAKEALRSRLSAKRPSNSQAKAKAKVNGLEHSLHNTERTIEATKAAVSVRAKAEALTSQLNSTTDNSSVSRGGKPLPNKNRSKRAIAAHQARQRQIIIQQLLTQKILKAHRDKLLRELIELNISEVEYRMLVAQLGQLEVTRLTQERSQRREFMLKEVEPALVNKSKAQHHPVKKPVSPSRSKRAPAIRPRSTASARRNALELLGQRLKSSN